jgi:tyrosyl-tRNA synthetase
LGHEVTFLVGDYTAKIGDPTGRNKLRPPLTDEAILANAATYAEQCFKILDRDRTVIAWNSTWLAKLSFEEIIRLGSSYTLARMMERRDFRQRFDEGREIALHELLYPLVQAYDSVELNSDVELGGHDQVFNLNVGRHLMKVRDMQPQIVLTVPLLVGLDGEEKMSKSYGNHVGVDEPPKDMFGKIMSISDDTMWKWMPMLVGRDPDTERDDPLGAKKRLAAEMVARFHDAKASEAVLEWWNAGRPAEDVAEIQVDVGPLYKVVFAANCATSGGDAKRKIKGGGVSLDDVRQTDAMGEVAPGTYRLRVGKRTHARIVVS